MLWIWMMVCRKKSKMVVASLIRVIHSRICSRQTQTIKKSKMIRLNHSLRLIVFFQIQFLRQFHIMLYFVVIVHSICMMCCLGRQLSHVRWIKRVQGVDGRGGSMNRNLTFQTNIAASVRNTAPNQIPQ